jgi:trigger factor
MLQEIEELSPTKRKLTINVPTEVIKSETDSAYNEIRANAKIPGFRQGKVPHSILVKKFSKNVEAQIIEKVVPEYYMKAVTEAKIEPVSYPQVDEQMVLKTDQPLSFTVTVEIKPVISDISFDGISLKEKALTIEDHEVEKALNSMREAKALYAVSDEALKEGDMAIIDSEAYIDGELKDELTYKGFPFVLGSNEMPKEFTDALQGKKNGEIAETKLNFEADNPNKTLAGKEVQFKIAVTEVKEKKIPPLDDDFASENDCKTVEELTNKVRDHIGEQKQGMINLDYKKEILDELIKRHDFAVPESMVQGEIESIVEREKQEAMRKGQEVKPDDELKKESESTAKENIKSVILLEAIGKKENIQVTDEDTKKAIDEIAARNNLKPEEVTKLYAVREGSMDALKSRLFADKVLDHILEKATIEKS